MRNNKIKSTSSSQFIVRGVDLWNVSSIRECVDIVVKDGIVTRISGDLSDPEFANYRVIDASGLVVMPAGVDAQVHLRVPGQEQKETASSGLWAAVAGGVGALLTMPNTNPVLDHPGVLETAKRETSGPESETGVKVLFSAAMTKGQKGKECVDFEGLAYAGVAAFTDDGVGVADDNVMLEVLSRASRTGLPLLQHAEVPGHGGVLAAGPVQVSLGSIAYPESAETNMVKRDLRLLEQFPAARYHVLHVSAAATLDAVKYARKKGLHVSCEVSPHHLFFSSRDIEAGNSSFKMNPPIRSESDRALLQKALSEGDCDFMATDHAPHELAVKTSNLKTSAFGTTGLETSLRVMIWLWQSGKISASRLVDTWATAPAKFLGISATHGVIEEGRPFNAVICDVKASNSLVMTNDFIGRSLNSCFIGSKLPGRVLATILGERVHCLNEFKGLE
jgi:dihydroorotase